MNNWKIFPYNTNYECSINGEIRNKKTKKILKTRPHPNDGYLLINLSQNGIKTTHRVHRVILETFQPIEDPSLYDVNHKNGIRTDNSVSNLEWLPAKINRGIKINEQRGEITLLINQLINKIGYDKTKNKLQNILNNT